MGRLGITLNSDLLRAIADKRLVEFVYKTALDRAFDNESALTMTIAKGLRGLFKKSYPVSSSSSIHQHVVYRDGDEKEDKLAWNASIPDKWIGVHGLRFVPDVLIRRTLNQPKDVLPIEIKLVKKLACSQAIATAIGQCVAYVGKYPRSILFVGVQRGLVKKGKFGLTDLLGKSGDEANLRCRLEKIGICLIFREVGVSAGASP